MSYKMKIHYVINEWGRLMPIKYERCCQVMSAQFSPEGNNEQFRLSRNMPRLEQYSPSGKTLINDNVTNCPNCNTEIKFIERELKEEYDE